MSQALDTWREEHLSRVCRACLHPKDSHVHDHARHLCTWADCGCEFYSQQP